MSALSCPNCQKKIEAPNEHRPFCTARCKMVDLSRWLGGEYAVASDEPVDIDELVRLQGEETQ